MKNLYNFFLLALIFVILASCATVVTFDVERPPLVDLRNVNSITVIPFEWNTIGAYANIAKHTTSAFLYGIRMGKISAVDPYDAEKMYGRNFWRYADVYITGSVTNVTPFRDSETKEVINNKGEKIIVTVITSTVYIDIEYAYVRSVNNEVLGRFTKTAKNDETREIERDQDGRPLQPFNNPRQRETRPGGTRSGETRSGGARREGGWSQSLAEGAALSFSHSLYQELGPWTAKEKRNLKRGTGNNSQVSEAANLIGQNNYAGALEIYNDIYERTGSVFFGYNTAVLLEANENFTEALSLLKALNKKITESGKTTPSFIRNEIRKIEEYLYGFRILEDY
jgi:hypothetical protein